MSANDWVKCPKCSKLLDEDTKNKYNKANESYGKVSAQEYQRLLEDAQGNHNGKKEIENSLAEYYEIGILNTSRFYISYSASCSVCGFSYSYKVDRALLKEELE